MQALNSVVILGVFFLIAVLFVWLIWIMKGNRGNMEKMAVKNSKNSNKDSMSIIDIWQKLFSRLSSSKQGRMGKESHKEEVPNHNQLRNSIENTIKREYGLVDLEPENVKELIDLGKTAHNCHKILMEDRKKNNYELDLIPKNETTEEWLRNFPKLLEASEENITKKNSEITRLTREVRLLERDADLKAQRFEQEQQKIRQLRFQIDEIEKENKNLQWQKDGFQRKIEDLQAQLISAAKEIERRQGEIIKLRVELNDKARETDSLLGERHDLQTKIQSLQTQLTSTIKELEKKHSEIIKSQMELSDRMKEINNLLEEKYDLQRKIKALQEEITRLQAQLSDKNKIIDNLQQEVDRLKRDLKKLEQIERNFRELERMAKLIPYIQQEQRDYLEEKKRDPASAAVLSFFITHSLFLLWDTIRTDDKIRKNAMLVNLHSIATKLEKNCGFVLMLEKLNEYDSNLNSLEKTLVPANKDHLNDDLFRLLLKHARDYARINFAPFYFDTDKDGKVYYAN